MDEKKRTGLNSISILRSKAVKRIPREKQGDPVDETDEDLKALFHELQIHQIELEIQNEELLRVNTENEELKNKYFDLYELAPAGYLTLDKNGIILELNLSASSIFNYEKSNMKGKNFTFFLDQQDIEKFYHSINTAIKANSRQTCHVRTKAGKVPVKYLQLDEVPYSDENGKVTKIFMAVIDISLIKLAEEEIIKAKKTEELNLAKNLFIANINHELRTPMVTIMGYSQILMNDQSLNDKQMEKIKIMNKSGEILLNLINDLLDISKIEAGKVSISHLPFNLPELLKNIADAVSIQAEEKNLSFSLETTNEIPVNVTGDVHKLRQVLLNLLINAVKYTENGVVVFRAGIIKDGRASAPAGMNKVRFEIEDNGVGIEADQIEKIFEPFYQSIYNKEAKTKGFGLGLAVSRQLVRLMGSEIYVKSKPGSGSVFWFDLNFEKIKDEYTEIMVKKPVMARETVQKTEEILPPPVEVIRSLFEMSDRGDILGIRHYINNAAHNKPELQPFFSSLNQYAKRIDFNGLQGFLSKFLGEDKPDR